MSGEVKKSTKNLKRAKGAQGSTSGYKDVTDHGAKKTRYIWEESKFYTENRRKRQNSIRRVGIGYRIRKQEAGSGLLCG